MKLRAITFDNPIPVYFKIAFLVNHFRDPTNRIIEKTFALTRPEFSILFCLAQMDQINAIDVADITQQPKNSLSRGAAALLAKKLITRTEDEVDKRKKLLSLTRAGKKEYRKILGFLEEANDQMVAPLSAAELSELDRLLSKMCSAVHDE